jgi:large subunit ribosomal protein L5
MTTIFEMPQPVNLVDRYKGYSIDFLSKKYSLTSMQVPKIEKIIVTTTLGALAGDKNYMKLAIESMGLITGQKPVITKARKSIASFKVREGMETGLKVTLRKKQMFDFLDRLVYITLPRIRDFKGLSKNSFDADFNYNIGIKDCTYFHEIDMLKMTKESTKPFGVNITLRLKNVASHEQAHDLLTSLLFPIK